MTIVDAVVAAIALQRLLELVYARRNERRLLRRGGRETGAGHYPLLVALHAAWLVAVWALAEPGHAVVPLLVAYVLLQPLRVWVIAALGPYWTTRVITVPGAPLVRRGPYRLLRHPNYVIVVLEMALLPLAFQLWEVAAVSVALKLAVLRVRLRVENAALASRQPMSPHGAEGGAILPKQG